MIQKCAPGYVVDPTDPRGRRCTEMRGKVKHKNKPKIGSTTNQSIVTDVIASVTVVFSLYLLVGPYFQSFFYSSSSFQQFLFVVTGSIPLAIASLVSFTSLHSYFFIKLKCLIMSMIYHSYFSQQNYSNRFIDD